MNPKTKERLRFLLGVAICFAVAALSVLLEKLIPGELLGASIVALFLGTIINSFSIRHGSSRRWLSFGVWVGCKRQ